MPDEPAASHEEDEPAPGSVVAIAPGCQIAVDELQWRFLPSGGPGGQHANRSNTRAELRFDIEASPSLDDRHRARLVAKLGPQIRITCDQERSQLRNRAIAMERFVERLQAALRPDPVRKRTRVPRGVNERRLENKKRRSETKRSRRWKTDDH